MPLGDFEFSEKSKLNNADSTWGAFASGKQADQTLRANEHVTHLAENATVLNLGAGTYLGLDALMHAARPDLRIVQIDSGYRRTTDVLETSEKPVEDIVDFGHTTSGYENRIAALVERLPVKSSSVDFLISHALIPTHLDWDSESIVLTEISRVLKVGATALIGPYNLMFLDSWTNSLEKAREAGQFSHHISYEKEIDILQAGKITATYMCGA